MTSCKDCKHFDTACVGTSAQTDYCRKTGETIQEHGAVRECFTGGRKTFEEELREAIEFFHKKTSPAAADDVKA